MMVKREFDMNLLQRFNFRMSQYNEPNGVFTSYFPDSSAVDQHQLNRNKNSKSYSRMSLPSHLQNFNIPDEFRQAPTTEFGELLGPAGQTNPGNYSKKMFEPPEQSSREIVSALFSAQAMRQVDEQMRQSNRADINNYPSEEQTDIDNLMEELLNDVDLEEDKSSTSCDRNSNSINHSTKVKEERADPVPALDQLGSLGLHSEINIKPEQPEEKKPFLSIRKDIFQSSPGQVEPQPNMMQDWRKPGEMRAVSHHVGRYTSTRRSDGVPLYDDPTLPPGWRRTVTQRKSGATAGGWDTYIHAPPSHKNKRFRSKQEVRRYFEQTGEQYLRWQDFDFNPFGSKGQHEMLLEMRRNPTMMGTGNIPLQTQGFPHQQQAQIEINPDISSFLSCELKQEND